MVLRQHRTLDKKRTFSADLKDRKADGADAHTEIVGLLAAKQCILISDRGRASASYLDRAEIFPTSVKGRSHHGLGIPQAS